METNSDRIERLLNDYVTEYGVEHLCDLVARVVRNANTDRAHRLISDQLTTVADAAYKKGI